MRIKVGFCGFWIGMYLFLVSLTPSAYAQQLISNGDFELGSLTNWTVAAQSGGTGSYFIATNPFAPISGQSTVGSAGGNYYAMSDSSGYGAQALLQTFTVPTGSSSVIVSFDMFVNDWSGAGPIINPAGLDYSSGPNQYARVDILSASVAALDTGSGVVQNLYEGVDSPGTAPPNGYTHYVFDLTSLLGGGGTYQIRFAEVNTESYLNQGIDNVSIIAVSSIPTVPESSSKAFLGAMALGFGSLFFIVWRRSRRSKV